MKFTAFSLFLLASSATAQSGGKRSGISLLGGKKGMSMPSAAPSAAPSSAPSESLAPSASPTFAMTDSRAPVTGPYLGTVRTDGSDSDPIACADGQLAVGFEGEFNGLDIVGFNLYCASVEFGAPVETFVGPIPSVEVDTSINMKTDRIGINGNSMDALCPDNSFLVGFRVANESNSNDDIHLFQGICSDNSTPSLPNPPPNDTAAPDEFRCPPGMAVTGAQGSIKNNRPRALRFTCSVPDAFAAP